MTFRGKNWLSVGYWKFLHLSYWKTPSKTDKLHETGEFNEILLGKIHFIFYTCDSENKTSIQSTNQNKPRFKTFETLLMENRINSCATCGSKPDAAA